VHHSDGVPGATRSHTRFTMGGRIAWTRPPRVHPVVQATSLSVNDVTAALLPEKGAVEADRPFWEAFRRVSDFLWSDRRDLSVQLALDVLV
jgi:hypothetical protein